MTFSIFAAAAINIKVSSQTPTPAASGTATPVSHLPGHHMFEWLHAETPLAQTKDVSPAPIKPSQSQSSMTAFARGKQEMARRILYSKFLRGQVIVSEDLDKIPGASDQPPKPLVAESGSSFLASAAKATDSRSSSVPTGDGTVSSDGASGTTPRDNTKKETKEEKAHRRAERAAKKAFKRGESSEMTEIKLLRKADKKKRKLDCERTAEDSPALEGEVMKKPSKSKGKRKERDAEVTAGSDGERREEKKRKRRESRGTTPADGTSVVDTGTSLKAKKKRKRQTNGE